MVWHKYPYILGWRRCGYLYDTVGLWTDDVLSEERSKKILVEEVRWCFYPWLIITAATIQPWKCYNQQWFWKYLFFIDYSPWYLQYLFVWYILFFVAHFKKWAYRFRWWIIGISAFLMFIFWSPMQQEQSLCFPFGMWIAENYDRIKTIDKRTYLKMSAGAAVIAVLTLGAKQIPIIRSDISSWTFVTLQLVLKTSMAIAVIGATPFITKICRSRFLMFTGLVSYEMYLAHGFIYEQSIQLVGDVPTLLFVCVFFPVLYFLCYLFYRVDNGTERMLNTIRK